MATTLDFVQFVVDCLQKDYDITFKPLFGEYVVYADEKPVLLVCDNCVFVKKKPELYKTLQNADCGYPYKWAKECYILDVEDYELTSKVIDIMYQITPVRKKKK